MVLDLNKSKLYICDKKNFDYDIPDEELSLFLDYPKLLEAKSGDIALFTRDDYAGLFITWFTISTLQHTGIFVWLDRKKYIDGVTEVVPSYNSNNNDINMLCFMTITKRRLNDIYTKKYRNGLILSPLVEFVKIRLVAIYNRPLSSIITDSERVKSLKDFITANINTMQYETDIRAILGVGTNIPYTPYKHRVVCTTMIHRYLTEHLGYPNRGYDCHFIHPNRDPAVFRAKDFLLENNQSPVLGGNEELIYGSDNMTYFGILHPFTVSIVLGIFLLIVILIVFVLNFRKKTYY